MTTKKNATGTVGLESKAGMLRLRLPRSVNAGKQKYISLGLKDNPENRRKAMLRALEIERDIAAGIPITLDKKPDICYDIRELWDRYLEFKKPQIEVTTYLRKYLKISRIVSKLPTHDPRHTTAIVDYIYSHHKISTVELALRSLSTCCDWAISRKYLTDNPFHGIAKQIVVDDETYPDPFTSSERDAIISAFDQLKPHYAPFVKFLFLTGCRIGEAIALRWVDIEPDFKSLTFRHSFDSQYKILKKTKTGKSRVFPCNPSLQQVLLSVKSPDAKPSDPVFTRPNGTMIHNSRFITDIWKGRRNGKYHHKGVLTKLIESGKVSHYRSPYHCRHTFITMALTVSLTISQVAYLVGNSPKTILKHYAGHQLNRDIPIEL